MRARWLPGFAAAVALLSFLAIVGGAASALAAPDTTAPVLTYDVVVVGAGTGGVAAALQAARMGRRVALIEETDWIGGQLTAGGVGTLDGDVAIRASGLYRELVERVRAFYEERGKSPATCYWSTRSLCVNPGVGQAILLALIDDTRARTLPDGTHPLLDLHLMTSITSVLRFGDVVEGVQAADGRVFRGAIVIDATEHGDLLPMAGARYRVGNGTSDGDSGACIQDITYAAVIRWYPRGSPPDLQVRVPPPDYAQARSAFARKVTRDGSPWFVTGPSGQSMISSPVNFYFHNGYRGLPDLMNPADYTSAQVDLPNITKTGVNWANDYPGVRGWLPTTYLTDPDTRRALACEAKLVTLNFLHYIQEELGYRHWSVANDEGFDTPYSRERNDCPNIPAEYKTLEAHFPLRPYVRESRRLVGVRTLTARDIQRTGNLARPAPIPSAVAIGDYGVDLHNCDIEATLETALETRADINGDFDGFFQIPFEAFIPETLDGFLVAEKNLSQTRLVNGATRLQPVTMLTGQAAGAIAAIAAERRLPPRRVKAFWVQDALVGSGAVIAPHVFSDAPPSHPFFPYTQIAATRGIVLGATGTTFGLGDEGTRRMMARAIVRGFDLPVDGLPAVPTFADVPVTDPDFAHVEALHRSGITAGCGSAPKRFCPDAGVTRAQLSVFLVRALALDPVSAPPQAYFSDVGATASYFPHVQLMRSHGLAAGCAPGAFCPEAGVTRGQMAAFVVRAMRRLP